MQQVCESVLADEHSVKQMLVDYYNENIGDGLTADMLDADKSQSIVRLIFTHMIENDSDELILIMLTGGVLVPKEIRERVNMREDLKRILSFGGLFHYVFYLSQINLAAENWQDFQVKIQAFVKCLRQENDEASAEFIESHSSTFIDLARQFAALQSKLQLKLEQRQSKTTCGTLKREIEAIYQQFVTKIIEPIDRLGLPTFVSWGEEVRINHNAKRQIKFWYKSLLKQIKMCYLNAQKIESAAAPPRVTLSTWYRSHPYVGEEEDVPEEYKSLVGQHPTTMAKNPAIATKASVKECQSLHGQYMFMMSLNFSELFGDKVCCSVANVLGIHSGDLTIKEGKIKKNNDGVLGNFDDPRFSHPCWGKRTEVPLMIKINEPGHVFCAFVTNATIEIWDTGKGVAENHRKIAHYLRQMFPQRSVFLYHTGVQAGRFGGYVSKRGMLVLDFYCQTWIYFVAWLRFVYELTALDTIRYLYSLSVEEQKDTINEFQTILHNAHSRTSIRAFNVFRYPMSTKRQKQLETNFAVLRIETEEDMKERFERKIDDDEPANAL